MIVDHVKLRLSAQKALLNNIFPNLRAVFVGPTEGEVLICFYIDGEISEEDRKVCESVSKKILSDVLHFIGAEENVHFNTPIVRLDFPNKMPLNGLWVYYRRENTAEYV